MKQIPQLDLDLKTATKQEIQDVVKNYSVAVFRNQTLSDEEYESVGKKFGKPYVEGFLYNLYKQKYFEKNEYIVPLSSDGILGNDELDWHKDNIFEDKTFGRLLYAKSIPNNNTGKTYWADMIEIYEKLPIEIKEKIENAELVYNFNPKDKKLLDNQKWIRIVEKFNNKKTLNLSTWIDATPVIAYKNIDKETLDEITKFVYNKFLSVDDNLYVHDWNINDIVYFNNLTTLHRRDKIDSSLNTRLVYRLTVEL